MLKDTLTNFKISNFTWNVSTSNKYIQVIFPLESGSKCEEVLDTLETNGIGKTLNSVVSVLNCSIYSHYKGKRASAMEIEEESTE